MKTAVIVILLLSVIAIDTKVRGDTLCDTGVKITVEIKVEPSVNVLIVRTETGQLIIVGVDRDRNGTYEAVAFDTNLDGYIDVQLLNGWGTAEQAIQLYCKYMRWRLS